MKRTLVKVGVLAVLTLASASWGGSDTAPCPVAIFPFAERGVGVKGFGQKVSDILFAEMAAVSNLLLVEREELSRVLDEQAMNLSGMVAPDQAVRVGQLTGARLIITGSVVETDKTIQLVAKLIGVETSRMLGASVEGRAGDPLAALARDLAVKVSGQITAHAADIMPAPTPTADRLAALRKQLGDAPRPVLMVAIGERHVGQPAPDPAAETEFIAISRAAGFDVLDSALGAANKADILIKGEGLSEVALRRGGLVSVKARVEVKAIERVTGKIVVADSQTTVQVDVSEQIAAKQALQKAASDLAERVLPKLLARD